MKFSYRKLLDGLARSNFVWINYNRETTMGSSIEISKFEIKLKIPN